MPNLHTLPEELICRISQHLSLKEQMRLEEVCKALQLVLRHPKVRPCGMPRAAQQVRPGIKASFDVCRFTICTADWSIKCFSARFMQFATVLCGNVCAGTNMGQTRRHNAAPRNVLVAAAEKSR